MRIAAVLAGFTMGQSDMLRKAMGKKDPKVMAKQREAFMAARGEERRQREEGDEDFRPDGVLRRLRLQQVAFDDLCVARVSDGVPQGELSRALHGRAAHDRGGEHRQAGACISASAATSASRSCRPTSTRASWRSRWWTARSGSDSARSRTSARARSCRCSRSRKELGRIDSLYSLCEHSDLRLVNKRVLESLVKAGGAGLPRCPRAPARSASRRARLFAAVDRAIEHGGRHQRDRDKGQSQLFGGGDRRRPVGRSGCASGRAGMDRDPAAGG